MGNRISNWLEGEPIPRELRARVLGDPRLSPGHGAALRSRVAFTTVALVVLLVGGGLSSVLLRGVRPGGAVSTVPSAPTTSASPSAVPSPSPTGTAPVVQPSPLTSIPPKIQPCQTAQLTMTIGRFSGAAGTLYVPFVAKNGSASACTVSGYFGLALLDASGNPVGGTPRRDPYANGTTPPAGPVLLAPGASATFTFHWSDVQSSSQPCPTATRVELTAPNQVDHVFIAAQTADGMKIVPCQPGGTGLSPVTAL